MESQRLSISFYVTVGLIAGAIIAYQIAVMRVFSVGTWSHFGSLTVSNLGMFDVDEFAAILNPPHGTILAIGSAKPRPWVGADGQQGLDEDVGDGGGGRFQGLAADVGPRDRLAEPGDAAAQLQLDDQVLGAAALGGGVTEAHPHRQGEAMHPKPVNVRGHGAGVGSAGEGLGQRALDAPGRLSIARCPMPNAHSHHRSRTVKYNAMTRLQIANLTKRFGSVLAVDAMDLTVEPGELFFLLGPSGCGKTTLLRMLAGFVVPDAGTISLDGRDVTGLPAHRRNCGMVFQNYALWPHMTVAENIAFGLRVRRTPAGPRRERVDQMLAIVRLEGLAGRRPAQLSGGQQQRVALARALAIKPALLLLDEPLSNLDAKLRVEMRGEIIRICRATGVTAVYVTHDQKEALSMADRLAVVRDGRIVQVGQPADVYRRPASRFVADFLGRANFLGATVRSADAGGVRLDCEGLGAMLSRAAPDATPSNGQRVLCSLRPEAVRLIADGPTDPAGENSFPAELVETVYLGEIAQHTLRLADGKTLDAYELHPRFGAGPDRTVTVRCRIDPADLTILPEGD